MKQPRIIMVIERYAPIVGGSEQQCHLLSTALHRHGVSVRVLTRRIRTSLAPKEIIDGVPVERVGAPGTGRIWKELSFALTAALWLIRHQRQYNIIHAHSATSITGLVITLIAKMLRKRILVKIATEGDISKQLLEVGSGTQKYTVAHRVLNYLINQSLHRVDVLLCISKEIVAEAQRDGFSPSTLRYLPNAVDAEQYHPISEPEQAALRKQLGLPLTGQIVIFTGRFISRKGIDTLLEAWEHIGTTCPDSSLVLLGNSSHSIDSTEQDIHDRIQQHPYHDRIYTLGEQSVLPYLQTATVFAFPSRREGLSNALLEAMACGLGIVASDIGGNRDLIRSQLSGILVQPNSPQELSAGVIGLLQQPETRRAFGQAARNEILENYSMQKLFPQYLLLYNALI